MGTHMPRCSGTPPHQAKFSLAASEAIANQSLQVALGRLTDTLMAGNRRAFATLQDCEPVRDHAKRIKEHTLAHLDGYLEQLESSVIQSGGQVHWAATADDACRAVVEIARRHRCLKAVKSKSMTSEEIRLNSALESAGIEVTETDFGEFILQLAGEHPSHLVAPAVHHTRESIAAILSKVVGGTVLPPDPVELAAAGRRLLREKFQAADMGITGVNFAIAECGTVVLVTNEGNGRLTTTWPRVHVAIMGMEKVIPRMQDLPVFLKLLARAATGQTISVYTTLISGPRKQGELDGAEHFHLVILDNGRSQVLGSAFRESLQCIRCGACLNVCPVYRRVGGHAYGSVYSGPIGSVLTPIYDSAAHHAALPQASSLCGACRAACPVRIDIPRMLIGLREVLSARQDRVERFAYRVWQMVLTRPWLYRVLLRCARLGMLPLSSSGWVDKPSRSLAGWTGARDFPLPAGIPFYRRWQDL